MTKRYTRAEALQFLVERLESWPDVIDDAPLCPGWGWESAEGGTWMTGPNGESIVRSQWKNEAGLQLFVSVEDAQPAPYTRDEALQFLVERLDSWPADIADAPLCPGWGWAAHPGKKEFVIFHNGSILRGIVRDDWCKARPDFTPFVSVEDAQPAPDMVNHPPHYQSDNGIECIDAIRAALGRDGFVSYCTGNAIKYLWRDKTDRVEDLRKAAWYLNRAIQEVSGGTQTDR